jgi:hypothetical protein
VTDGLSDLARRLLAVLEAARSVWVPIHELRSAAQESDASMRGTPDARERLRGAIDELVGAGLVRVPAAGGRLWENTPHPPLPLRVGRPTAAPSAPRVRTAGIAWHHRLSWVPRFLAQDRPTPDEHALLMAVNGLLRDEPARVVPLRERSFQLTGKEKALDQFLRGRLFADGRLTLALLKAEVVTPRLVEERVGDGPVTLVVENYTTFHSLVAALPSRGGRVGRIVWGAGNQLGVMLPALAADPPAELRYFGDLDVAGLRIAVAGSGVAESLGLPPLRPAALLYTALVEVEEVQPVRAVGTVDSAVLEWLPAQLRERARAVLSRGRIPQEAVGLEQLVRMDLRDP